MTITLNHFIYCGAIVGGIAGGILIAPMIAFGFSVIASFFDANKKVRKAVFLGCWWVVSICCIMLGTWIVPIGILEVYQEHVYESFRKVEVCRPAAEIWQQWEDTKIAVSSVETEEK